MIYLFIYTILLIYVVWCNHTISIHFVGFGVAVVSLHVTVRWKFVVSWTKSFTLINASSLNLFQENPLSASFGMTPLLLQ